MTGNGSHYVVGNASGLRSAHPGWVCKKRIETTFASLSTLSHIQSCSMVQVTHVVKVDVYATIVSKDEITDCICAHYRVGITFEDVQEP